MPRLPFDPSRVEPRATKTPNTGDDPLTVAQLAAAITRVITTGMPGSIRVAGEVSGFRDRTHWYFDLKDGEAVISAVMFASHAKRSPHRIEDGDQVIARGRLDFYAPGGKLSFIVDRVEPVGRGVLERQLRERIEELRGKGWLDPGRKRALPVLPRRVGVVTSRTGAALQDVIDTARRRCAAVDILIADARVQGEHAAREVAAAVRHMSEHAERLGIDAILVTRGGGSMEDLWAFNDADLAREIVTCSVPVVAAVGHETDTTIAELVADLRAATPTQAAMALVPDAADLRRQVDALRSRMTAVLSRRVTREQERLRGLERSAPLARPLVMTDDRRQSLALLNAQLARAREGVAAAAAGTLHRLTVRLERRRPVAVLAKRAEHVAMLAARLGRVGRRLIEMRAMDITALERELAAVGPAAVLARGFTVTLDDGGNAVRSASRLADGSEVRTITADGAFRSVVGTVEEANAANERPEPVRLPPRRKRNPRGVSPDQMDLFGLG
ncbi:MAG: exodeoxyribonuclease VII large subunit [Planctomycetota bacterium]